MRWRIFHEKAVPHLSKKSGGAFIKNKVRCSISKTRCPIDQKRSTAFTDKIVRGSILIERCAKYLVVVFGGGFIFSIQGNADN